MNNKCKYLFLLIVFWTNECFSRAGGGGGGGSGSGGGGSYEGGYYGRRRADSIKWEEGDGYRLIIILVVIGLLSIVGWKGYKWLIAYKNSKVNKKLAGSSQLDKLWDSESLEKMIRDVYFRMQKAWMEQDMNQVADITGSTLRTKFQRLLDRQKRAGIYNFLDRIDIKEIKIVGLEDYLNNDLDNFTAYISGSMTDVMVRKGEHVIKSQGSEDFEDLYYFKRKGERWYLVEISNTVDLCQLSELNILCEEA